MGRRLLVRGGSNGSECAAAATDTVHTGVAVGGEGARVTALAEYVRRYGSDRQLRSHRTGSSQSPPAVKSESKRVVLISIGAWPIFSMANQAICVSCAITVPS